MSCTVEVYEIVNYPPPDTGVYVRTNLGYMHYAKARGVFGMFAALGWQHQQFGGGKRKARYDSWLRDAPPECLTTSQEAGIL